MSNINIEKQEILLYSRLIDTLDYNKDTGIFTNKISRGRAKEGNISTSKMLDGYLQITLDSIVYKAHRLAWFYIYKVWPIGFIDHIDRDRSNNSISNLREVTSSLNNLNTSIRKDNISGYKGVYFHKQSGKYRAKITINGKSKHLGNFDLPEKASEAYQKALKEVLTK